MRFVFVNDTWGVDGVSEGPGCADDLYGDRFEGNLKAIRTKGTIVGMGSASGKIEAFDPKVLYPKNVKFVYPS